MERLLLRPKEAAALLKFSESLIYRLMRTDSDFRKCVVSVPNIRGKRIHAGRLQEWADSLLQEKKSA